MATRFVANRTFTSLRAIYSHFGATSKSEKESARTQAYGSLRRSSRGREVIGKIEKRRAASRKAAITRKEQKQAFTQTVSDFFAVDEYPTIEPDYSRNYSQRHAYVLRVFIGNNETRMVTILSDTALTVDEIGEEVSYMFSNENNYTKIPIEGFEIVAHYINRGAK
jgi:hypothetical protein